jgi:GNAT superfamily N-acetyltransferase
VNTSPPHKTPDAVSFVPVRWWQAMAFLRMNFELVRGIDPLADHILSRPWAPSSVLEYAYMWGTFLRSTAHFIVISGARAGVAWADCRARLAFILNVSISPQFQKQGVGMETVAFIEAYAKRRACDALATVMAAGNKPVQWLARASGGRSLGLATTTLTLSDVNLPTPPASQVESKPLERLEAIAARKRWKLHEVERVSGADGVDVASRLLTTHFVQPLPRGQYYALYQDQEEIGFASVHQDRDSTKIELFPNSRFWPGPETVKLIAAFSSDLGLPIHHLTLTQTHADALADTAPFDFERHREWERIFLFKRI